jgi:hypothetical protein
MGVALDYFGYSINGCCPKLCQEMSLALDLVVSLFKDDLYSNGDRLD